MEVAEVTTVGDVGPRVVFEIPHGATRTTDFESLRASLRGPFPDDLVDFFHVNTDAGAPELAAAIARRLGARCTLLRCLVPRTFCDTNRVIDAAGVSAAGMTAGVGPWVRDPADIATLLELHARYQRLVDDALVGADFLVMVHTYAPRSVDVEVDVDIGRRMREAWADPERWPLRPEVDLIARTTGGELLADAGLVDALVSRLGATVSRTYPLHPATTAFARTLARPGRCLCFEVRRDLLADPWEPFAQMRISEARVARVAEGFAEGIGGVL